MGIGEMGSNIMDISSLPPLKWLNIADGTCFGKVPKIHAPSSPNGEQQI
jgi:hypothetical protein